MGWFFACLVRLFPREFRDRFGGAMGADLEADWRSRRQLRERLRFLLRATVDAIASAWVERFARRAPDEPSPSETASPWELAFHDARQALRRMLRQPASTAVLVLTLALGLGIVTAVYALVDGVLLEPLPYPEPDRLVRVWCAQVDGDQRFLQATWQEIERFRRLRSFASVAALSVAPRDLLDDAGQPTGIELARVSAGFVDTVGLRPLLGRGFTADEAAAGAPVLLLDHGFWRQRYGGEDSILGRTVRVQGQEHEIVGVLPATFDLPHGVAFWRPFTAAENRDDDRELVAFARLAAGTTVEQANVELAAVLAGDGADAATAWVQPFRASLVREVRQPLWMLLAAVGALLLLTCSNVAHLQLSRMAWRRQEMAVRSALGADGQRLVRLLLFESLALTVAAGLSGLAVGHALLGLFRRLAPADLPRLAEVAVDGRVVLVVAALTAVTGLAAGWFPARRGARADPGRDLRARDPAGGRRGARRLLVTVEVALATLLVTTAGLLFTSIGEQLDVDHGVDLDGVLRIGLSPPAGADEPADRPAFYDRMVRAVAGIPGVEAVGVGNHDALAARGFLMPFELADGAPAPPGGERKVITRIVDAGWMEAAGLRLLAGRLLDHSLDRVPAAAGGSGPEAAGAVVVDRIFVRQEMGLDEPSEALGQRLRHPAFFGDAYPEVHRVVGVVAAVRAHAAEAPMARIYLPYSQFPWPRMHLLVRVERASAGPLGRDPEAAARALIGRIRARIWALEPEAPLGSPETLAQAVAGRFAHRQFQLRLLGGFAQLALLLAATGVFAMLSAQVAGRLREIGLRRALGAGHLDVARRVLGSALGLLLPGLACGLAGSFWVGKLLAHQLYGVTAVEPALWLAAAACLVLVGLLAALLPLRRALAAQPTRLLRQD